MTTNVFQTAIHNMSNFPYMTKMRIRKKDSSQDIFAKYAVGLSLSLNNQLVDQGYIPYDSQLVLYYKKSKDFKENIRCGYDGEILIEFNEKHSPKQKLELLLSQEENLRKRVLEIAKKVSKNRTLIDRMFQDIVKEIRWNKKDPSGNSLALTHALSKPRKDGVVTYTVSYLSKIIFSESIRLFDHINNVAQFKYSHKQMIVKAIAAKDQKKKGTPVPVENEQKETSSLAS